MVIYKIENSIIITGISEATVVIERCKKEYPDSALYLFFKGRLLRLEVCRIQQMMSCHFKYNCSNVKYAVFVTISTLSAFLKIIQI